MIPSNFRDKVQSRSDSANVCLRLSDPFAIQRLKSDRKIFRKGFKSFTFAGLMASTLWVAPAEQAFALATNGNAVNALVSPLGIGRCTTRIGTELGTTSANSRGANIELKNPGNVTAGQLLLRRTSASNNPSATVQGVFEVRVDNSASGTSQLVGSSRCGFANTNDPRHPSGITFRSNTPNVGDNWNAVRSFSLEANFTEGPINRYYYFAELSTPVVGGSTSQYRGAVRKNLLNPRPTIAGPAEYRPVGATPVTITFDQAVSGFTLGDIGVVGGTAAGFVPSGTNEWTIQVTPDGSGNPITVSVASRVADSVTLGLVDNLASPNLVATPLQMTLGTDSTPPTPTVATDGGTPALITDLTPFTAQVSFDENINDFDDLTDVTITNGTLNSITPTATPNVFTVNITPDGNGDVGITVPINVATDDAGNDNIASNTLTVPLDDTPPTPTVSADAGTPSTITTSDPFTVTVTFDEDINDFDDLTDVTVTNGNVTDITPTGGNTFVLTVVPTSTTEPVSITVPENVATDDVGNPNVVSNTLVITNEIDDTITSVVEEILEEDLLTTTRMLSHNASSISRRAADRLRFDRGDACLVEINELLNTTPVRFANDSFFVDASNDQLLDDIALALSKCDTARFMIAGHTSSPASDAYNLVLSQNRVDAVKAALVRRGIASTRLETRGFGENRPIATNATAEGQALNRRVEFILLDGGDVAAEPGCGDGQPLSGNADTSANDAGFTLNGIFGSGGYDCVTGEHTETWGSINVVRDDNIGTQGMASFGIAKERQIGNMLRGRFIEGYVSRKEVETDDADGTITGVGVHGGLYGAHATENGLVMNYYGSAAVGRHAFDLNVGADVDGSYTYAGLFAGAAVAGEQTVGDFTLKPRAGIDVGYSRVIGSEISNTSTLDIEPATYARGSVELGLVRETGQGPSGDAGYVEVAPRVFCEVTEDEDADACGYGARIDFASAMSAAGTQWNAEFDYETIGDRDQASFSVIRTQSVMNGAGVSRFSFGANANGALELAQTLEFSW